MHQVDIFKAGTVTLQKGGGSTLYPFNLSLDGPHSASRPRGYIPQLLRGKPEKKVKYKALLGLDGT